MKIRYIHVMDATGADESVLFTEDFDTPATDYCRPKQHVYTDETLNVELPVGFPFEFCLNVER